MYEQIRLGSLSKEELWVMWSIGWPCLWGSVETDWLVLRTRRWSWCTKRSSLQTLLIRWRKHPAFLLVFQLSATKWMTFYLNCVNVFFYSWLWGIQSRSAGGWGWSLPVTWTLTAPEWRRKTKMLLWQLCVAVRTKYSVLVTFFNPCFSGWRHHCLIEDHLHCAVWVCAEVYCLLCEKAGLTSVGCFFVWTPLTTPDLSMTAIELLFQFNWLNIFTYIDRLCNVSVSFEHITVRYHDVCLTDACTVQCLFCCPTCWCPCMLSAGLCLVMLSLRSKCRWIKV